MPRANVSLMTVIRFPEGPDPRPATERVSEEVRALMGRARINQTTVADWLGLTQSAVSARLRGDTEWKVSEIDVLARRFGVHPAVLLGGYAEGPHPGITMPPVGKTNKGHRSVRRQGLEPRTRYISASASQDGIARILGADSNPDLCDSWSERPADVVRLPTWRNLPGVMRAAEVGAR